MRGLKPAAAQEAVAWRYRHRSGTGSWHPWVMVSDEPKNKYPTSEYEPLYAAPVAAAPVVDDLYAHLLTMLGAKNHVDAGRIIGELHAATMGTPAAPGIDRSSLNAATSWLIEAAQAARQCIAELKPTQARAEVAQMLDAAILAALQATSHGAEVSK
jgi:hypothetical protein